MQEAFQSFIERHDLAFRHDRILLAVSGGVDSMVMLHLFREGGYRIAVAHCNFQLRGTASEEDEAFVSAFCKEHGITFHSKRFDPKNYARENGVSLQMAARDLRYAWFEELASKEKFATIATAHHLNDNLETLLLRVTHGAGLDQLTGIPVRNDRIIRPLLFATRNQIESFATSRGINFRKDASNDTVEYSRNFIRHKVVPLLKEINPGLETTTADTLAKLEGAHELMTRGLEQLKDTILRREGDTWYLDKNILSFLKNPAFVCYECLKPLGFNWDRCVQMAQAFDGQPGRQFFSESHRAVIDRDSIIVTRKTTLHEEILVEEGQDKAALGNFRIELKIKTPKVTSDADVAHLDLTKIIFPLSWRKWQKGDSFFPLGMSHPKKISDFLIDEKVPLSAKDDVTVLLSGGQVIWVVGYRVDDRYKVTPATRKSLEIRFNHN